MKPSCVLDASIIARWWVVGDKPNLANYIERLRSRPAYQRATKD